MITAYRVLCGVVGVPFVLMGIGFVVGFFQALAPGGEAPGPISPLGPMGAYMLAFCGSALVGWGGGLLGAMRRPDAGRTVGTWTAFALVLMAVYRLAGWLMGDYASFGEVLRVEAGLFLALAMAFVWLRPPRAASRVA